MSALEALLREAGMIEPASWVQDEEIWARAKKAAAKQKPDDLYALTTDIYKKMGGRIKTEEGGPGSGRHPDPGKVSSDLKKSQDRETLASSRLLQFQQKINQTGDQSLWNSQEYKDLASEYKSAVRARQKATRVAKNLVSTFKQADKTGVKTTHWFWGVEAFFPVKNAKPEVTDKPKEMSPADEEAQKLLIDNPNIPAATLLNALKSKGVKLVDEKDTLEADGVSANAAVTRAGVKRESAPIKFQTTAPLKEAVTKNAGVGPIRFRVALIQEGLGNLRDGFFYSKDAIQSGIAAFEGRKCFADHPSQSEEQDRPERSVRDIIGHFENVSTQENEDGSLTLVGDLVMPPDPPFEWARSLVRSAVAYNKKYPEQNLVGLSINASGDASEMPFDEFLKSYDLPEGCKPKLLKARENGMDTVRLVSSIRDAVSCDLVTEPGAKGKVLDIVEAESKEKKTMAKKEAKKAALIEAEEEKKMKAAEEEAKKALKADEEEEEEEKKEADGDDEDHEDVEQDKKLILDMIKKYMGDEEGEMEGEAESAAMEAYEAYKAMGESEDEAMKCAGKAMKLAKHMASKKAESEDEAKESEDEAEDEKKESEIKREANAVKLEARIAFLERELKKRELSDMLDSKLKESGLGRAETDRIRKIIGQPKSEAEISKTITIFKEAFSARGESSKGSGFFVSTEKHTAPAAKKGKVSFGECV